MDISSTTATTATTTATDVNTSSQNSSVSSKSDSSFKDEMKEIEKTQESKEEKKVSTKETKDEKAEKVSDEKDSVDKKSDGMNKSNDNTNKESGIGKQNIIEANELQNENQLSILSTQNMQNLDNEFETNEIKSNINTLLEANNQLKNLTQTTQLYGKIDYSDSNMQMTMEDAKFFVDLAQNTDKTLQNIMTEIQQGTTQEAQNIQKHVQVSETLLNNIATATKTNQPLRIDFDKDISVILKVDKDGVLSANFIPGDKAVEEYLRQNIFALRQSFDNQELSYKELTYSKQQQQQNKENNRRNNKENEQ